jgi:hypothetical protein
MEDLWHTSKSALRLVRRNQTCIKISISITQSSIIIHTAQARHRRNNSDSRNFDNNSTSTNPYINLDLLLPRHRVTISQLGLAMEDR